MSYAPNAYAVIMAGGRGERFWPLSRTARPKQFIELFGGKALLRHAVDRLEGLVPRERVFVVTSRDLLDASRAAAPSLPPENVVGEPCGRDTAAACALGTELVARQGGDAATLAILTADHLMEDVAGFRQTLRDAFALVAPRDLIATIGIAPHAPATGFGYIEAGERLAFDGPTVFQRARRFVEKPDLPTAQAYLAGGHHYWNAGMFVWSVATFRAALRRHCPDLAATFAELAPAIGAPDGGAALERAYAGLARISIDYAVMEHADNIVMARGTFGWDDVGALTAVANHFPADAAGNILVGATAAHDARGNIVLSDAGHLVALCGVENLAVVHTADATLVCARDRVQTLKALVRAIGERPDGARYL